MAAGRPEALDCWTHGSRGRHRPLRDGRVRSCAASGVSDSRSASTSRTSTTSSRAAPTSSSLGSRPPSAAAHRELDADPGRSGHRRTFQRQARVPRRRPRVDGSASPAGHPRRTCIAGLWSSEVLHALRQRPETFRSICPSAVDRFAAVVDWRACVDRDGRACSSSSIRSRAAANESFLRTATRHLTARARYRGYAEAADAIRRSTVSGRLRSVRPRATASCAATDALFSMQREVRADRRAAGDRRDSIQDPRRRRGAVDAGGLRLADGLLDRRVGHGTGKCRVLGEWHAEEHATQAQLKLPSNQRGRRLAHRPPVPARGAHSSGRRSPAPRPCPSRRPARPASRALPAFVARPGSTSGRRRRPPPARGRSRPGPPRCPSTTRRRGARRRCRRWQRPGSQPPRRQSTSRQRSSRPSRCRRARPPSSASTPWGVAPAPAPSPISSSSSPDRPTSNAAVPDRDRRRHGAAARGRPPPPARPPRGSADTAGRG